MRQFLAFSCVLAAIASSATLPFQGLSTDAKGNPRADGGATVAFALYSNQSGSPSLWAETQAVTTRKGLFSATLGSVSAIPDSLFDGRPLFLGVSVDNAPEASPRLRLSETPFALRSRKSDTAKIVLGLTDSLVAVRGSLAALASRDSVRSSLYADTARNATHLVGTDSVALASSLDQIAVLASKVRTDSAQLRGARDSIALLSAALSGMDNRLAALERVLHNVSRSADGATIYFDSVNVVVRNGTGSTESTNGVGNLVVGYNESRGGGWEGNDVRTGSHMVVIGSKQNYSSFGGIVAGTTNTVDGTYSSVTGGRYNNANGPSSSVVGGIWNTASGEAATTSGGNRNQASGTYSSVSGGERNIASGNSASVSGGADNKSSEFAASVHGGMSNTASGWAASVLGGSGITVSTSTGTSP